MGPRMIKKRNQIEYAVQYIQNQYKCHMQISCNNAFDTVLESVVPFSTFAAPLGWISTTGHALATTFYT